MTLLYLVAAWMAGIFLASTGRQPTSIWLALAGGYLALALLLRRNRRGRLALSCAMLLALGAFRYARTTRPLPQNHAAHLVDSGYLTLTGLVARDPDIRDNVANLYLQAEALTVDHEKQSVQGLILVQAPRYGEYAYGDRVAVSGQLVIPPEFDDFSYRDYLARRGVYAIMPNAEIEILAHDQGKPWYAAMYALKERAQNTIDRVLPSPQAPLLSGILLGVDTGIPQDVRDAFNRTGTSHIIAISGANIVVIIQVLLRLFKRPFGARRAAWLTLIGVTGYTLFVGADPSVVRAAIMGSMALLAKQLGRRTYGLTSLAFAIWLMTLWNPLVLWDIGFQLSVAATAGLVLFGDDFTHILERMLRRGFSDTTVRSISRFLAEPLTIGLAAQITTLPLILVYFGRLSAISLLANILIVPVQAYIMILGWPVVLAGLVWTGIAEPLAWIVWIPLTYTLEVVRSLGKPDWASVTVHLSSTYVWSVYVLLLSTALVRSQHPEDRAVLFARIRRQLTPAAVVAASLVVTILVWAASFDQPDGKLHVWFLDVGHGNAVLIESPAGAQILIDGGPNPTRLRKAVGDILPFWDHSLDLLIVTQSKASSINALPELLKHYDVKLALTTGQTADSDEYRALEQVWQKNSTQILIAFAGYRLEIEDGVTLEILHPQTLPAQDADAEAAGMVIRLSYGDSSFLLAPDLNDEAEETLREAGWYVGSTVLELPSHGSDRANPDGFLRAVHPQVAIATVGTGNRSGLPAPEVIERLAGITPEPLYRTDRHGTVEMVTDGQTLWVYTHH